MKWLWGRGRVDEGRWVSPAVLLTMLLLWPTSLLGADPPPNFLIMFADDMGYGQLSAYGGDLGTIHTPHIDAIAREGILFTDWYSGFHVCTPSRAAMLTGRLPKRVGMPSVLDDYDAQTVLTAMAVGGLPLNETTFAEALGPHGYKTGMLGKWHLGQRDMYLPPHRGFDMYFGIPFSCDMGTSYFLGYDVPNPPYHPTPVPLMDQMTVVEAPAALPTLTMRYADRAVEFIHEAAQEERPFVLYMPFNHVHWPNFCSLQWCNTSTRGQVGSSTQELDAAVGVVMEGLKTAGVDNNTLVFFTSDNGAPLFQDEIGNHPLRGGKAMCWEGGFRMPGMARWPGRIKPGRVSGELVATYDIFVTMMALAGVDLPTDRIYDGKDISPVLFDEGAQSPHKCIPFFHGGEELYAIRCGQYKETNGTEPPPPFKNGIQDPPLLFDVVADKGENHPLPFHTSLYNETRAEIEKVRDELMATFVWVQDQRMRGDSWEFAICADPESQKKYPTFPNCTITPDNWHPAGYPPVWPKEMRSPPW